MTPARPTALALSLLILLVACGTPRDQPADTTAAAPAASGVIDSALPIAEHLRRFRATLATHPTQLEHAERSTEALARQWVAAVAARDTAELRRLHLDRAEFADLVYEQLRLSKPPYEMPPALLWFQITANSDEGLRKSLDRLGGRRVSVRSVRCPTPVDTQGTLRLHDGCLLRLRVDADTLPETRYFGSMVERDGRFKFVGYSNKL